MDGNSFQKMVGGVDRDLSIRRDGLTDLDSPKHGKMDPDNAPHVGGNTWAGGTGGRDTAGMGGIGGPYRLDAGHDVHQLSDEVKEQVPEHIRYTVLHIFRQVLFGARNQGNYQNLDLSLLSYKWTNFHWDEAKRKKKL